MKFVAEPDLWVVICIVLAIASYFIIRELRQGGSHFARKKEERNLGDGGA
jgi:CHASE3 domain sensor protein